MNKWIFRRNITLGLVFIQLFLLWLGYYMSQKIAWSAVIIMIPWILWLGYTFKKSMKKS